MTRRVRRKPASARSAAARGASVATSATRHDARLALYADAPGTLWPDVVSLFPRSTYNGRPNGFRADLLQMLKDLRPGFVRFPGGCVTEGLTLEQGHAWKKTVGDIAERPGVWNAMWGYRRTDGLGMLELLQLAEDVGATALFCNNMGIACTIHTPGGVPCPPDQIQGYVDDTVDAISYAIDPPTTNWGALRAAHGHPEPFRLDSVNIGNELNSRELERNADLVRLVAYAPLFCNVNKQRWQPDLIHFDNHRVFGTPSYYTQQLFMRHRPDVVLATEVAAAGDPDLFALAGHDRRHGEIIVKIVNLDAAAKPVRLELENAAALTGKVAEWVMTAPDPLAGNSLDQPTRVAPVAQVTEIAGHVFTRTVPPHSFTVLRVGCR